MRRKALSILLSVTMVATLLSGCGKKNDEQPKSTPEPTKEAAQNNGGNDSDKKENVTLKWALWDEKVTPYYQALVDAYKEVAPNVTIEMVDLGSTDYQTVLATELSGSGSDLDVVAIKDVPGYATLVQKNAIEKLDSYIERDGIDLSKYAGITEQLKVDGSLYEMPYRCDFWLMYYNKDLFDQANVPYPTNDMTFEEYDALARQVSENSPKGFGEQVYGAHYHTWRSAVQLFGVLDGKHTILDGEYSFFKPYYEMVLGEEKDGICQKYSDLKTEGLHYSAAFSNGNVAMMNMGTWFLGTLIGSLKNKDYDAELCGNWGLVKYPHAEGVEEGATLGAIASLGIVSSSDVKEEAWNFIKFVSSEEGAKVITELGNFPAITSSQTADIISSIEGFPTDAASKEALNVRALYLEVPYAKNVTEINSALDSYHGSIMSGEMSIDDGIKAMNDAVAKIK